MAEIKYFFQGLIEEEDYLSALEYILQLDNIQKVVFSVAFVRKSGIDLIKEILLPYSDKVEFFIGIRNGVTSVQAVMELLKIKINTTLVDTASPSIIFHPKVFISFSDKVARVLIGSANLTSGGLVQNIEAGTIFDLDLSSQEDSIFVKKIIDSIYELRSKFPENVFKVENYRQAVELYREGRLTDERISTNFVIAGKLTKDKKDDLKKIELSTRKISRKFKRKTKKIRPIKLSSTKRSHLEWILLWESNPLTERDLNIPSGRNTNPTGSMLLKKGNMKGIDHRHFFRDVIFKDLNWIPDSAPSKAHLERTTANFELVIKGISYGIFHLRLTHNTRTDTRAYQQKNAMTQIHWGKAKEFVARDDLLNCTLRLYKQIGSEDFFIIEIT